VTKKLELLSARAQQAPASNPQARQNVQSLVELLKSRHLQVTQDFRQVLLGNDVFGLLFCFLFISASPGREARFLCITSSISSRTCLAKLASGRPSSGVKRTDLPLFCGLPTQSVSCFWQSTSRLQEHAVFVRHVDYGATPPYGRHHSLETSFGHHRQHLGPRGCSPNYYGWHEYNNKKKHLK